MAVHNLIMAGHKMLDATGTLTAVTISPILPHGPPKLAAYGKKPAGYALRRVSYALLSRSFGKGVRD